ncbi:MAG: hypothetical protein ACRDQ2_19595 [Gaiellales bacterium]
MTLSLRAKITLAVLIVVGIAVFLLIVDLGVNAGRIHHGVHVTDMDLGGLTREEAVERLFDRGLELQEAPVIVTRENVSCHFVPTELGWEAKPFETAVAAYRIGRGELPLKALGVRIRAWFSGVTIDWADEFNAAAVSRLLDRCEFHAEAVGYEVRRYRLRQKLARAITTWPRRPVNIPIRT